MVYQTRSKTSQPVAGPIKGANGSTRTDPEVAEIDEAPASDTIQEVEEREHVGPESLQKTSKHLEVAATVDTPAVFLDRYKDTAKVFGSTSFLGSMEEHSVPLWILGQNIEEQPSKSARGIPSHLWAAGDNQPELIWRGLLPSGDTLTALLIRAHNTGCHQADCKGIKAHLKNKNACMTLFY